MLYANCVGLVSAIRELCRFSLVLYASCVCLVSAIRELCIAEKSGPRGFFRIQVLIQARHHPAGVLDEFFFKHFFLLFFLIIQARHNPAAYWRGNAEPARCMPFYCSVVCFTSTKVQILTPVEPASDVSAAGGPL